jgi:hypothetical protein
LLRLLKDPAPDEEEFYDEGAKEVEQQIGNIRVSKRNGEYTESYSPGRM